MKKIFTAIYYFFRPIAEEKKVYCNRCLFCALSNRSLYLHVCTYPPLQTENIYHKATYHRPAYIESQHVTVECNVQNKYNNCKFFIGSNPNDNYDCNNN